MNKTGKTARFLLTVALIACSGLSLSANGLNLNGMGSKAIAMGGAFIGQADDYSAIFWNPAGLTQMQSPNISFFVTDLIPSGTYQFPLLGIDAKAASHALHRDGPQVGFLLAAGHQVVQHAVAQRTVGGMHLVDAQQVKYGP